MRLFLSYASEYQTIAEEVSLCLMGAGHEVIFDQTLLKAGDNYNRLIRDALADADGMVFLISPEAVQAGSYALTELKFAREKWPHPAEHLFPVLVRPTPLEAIPPYLRAVTILQPEGNVAAEVAAESSTWGRPRPKSSFPIVRVTVHLAYFESQPQVARYFVNVTNLSKDRDIVITHVWFEGPPRVFALPSERPLPARLEPAATWETWVTRESLPSGARHNPFESARVRLTTGETVCSTENRGVPEQGYVPGGAVSALRDE